MTYVPRAINRETLSRNSYFVTAYGEVISYKSGAPKILRQSTNSWGYQVVNLRLDGKSKLFMVHRLVAECFKKRVSGKIYVNHIDGNRSNNSASNLEWCTHRENMLHAARCDLYPSRRKAA